MLPRAASIGEHDIHLPPYSESPVVEREILFCPDGHWCHFFKWKMVTVIGVRKKAFFPKGKI